MEHTEPNHRQPPRVLVSRCLLGESVRYDGTDRRCHVLSSVAERFHIVPVCPEVEAGLGLPRPPVQWVVTGGGRRLRGVDDPSLDVTDVLTAFCRDYCRVLPPLQGAILKARSPSCAVDSAPLLDSQGRIIQRIHGAFVTALLERFPGLPLIDEAGLADPACRRRFLAAVEEGA